MPDMEATRARLRAKHTGNGAAREAISIPGIDRPEGRTDAANARRFARRFSEKIRWVDDFKGWLVQDGARWQRDRQATVEAMMKSCAAEHWQTIAEHPDPKAGVEMARFAKASGSARGVRDALFLARSEPGLAVLPERLDSDPWKFNCSNGTINLRTGELLTHEPTDLITKLAPVEYPTDAADESTLFKAVLQKILAGDHRLICFVKRLFGSALCGEVVEHVLPILWGAGSNGKTIVTETLLDVFGEYAGKVSSDLLLERRGDRHPVEKADLHGRRLVIAAESDEGRKLSEALIKELTGGETIQARRMRENFWTFRPQHTLFLITNHRPRVHGVDHALWRRLMLIPFVVRFWDPDRGEHGHEELQADKQLKAKLAAERPGILRWLVNGCLEWQRDGLGEPDTVRLATGEYRASEDTLAAFLADSCIIDRQFTCKASDLRRTYEGWCKDMGERPISGRRFGEYLVGRNIVRRLSNGTWYDGIGLAGAEGTEPWK
ncbi:MAG: hypothetical protein HYX69_06945 [Planctomycetia bacterium]|nr:hypothetical protein [Planctomycetia bacterium]